MATLHHSPFCPHSRFIRLVLAEMGMEPSLLEERPWERRDAFLIINPAGTTPVLVEQSGLAIPGAG
ncbi:MAG: glutathione S-transferase family protein, partial [Methylobacterium sp.]